MKRFFLLLTLFVFIAEGNAEEYIKRTPSAFTYKAIYDSLYWSVANDQTLLTGDKSGSFDLTTTGTVTAPINISSSTGVSATATNGVLTLQGLKSGGNNENIKFDFETNSDQILLSSTTSVTRLVFTTFGIKITDDLPFQFGEGVDTQFTWSTVGNDNFQLGLLCGSATDSGYYSLMEKTDLGNANRSPLTTSANPVLRIYSADATSATDYGEFYQDGTNFVCGLGEGVFNVVATDTTTNTMSEIRRTTHSGGAVAAGFGSYDSWYLEDATAGTIQEAGRLGWLWTDATDATRTSAFTISGTTSGGAQTEWARFTGTLFTTGNVSGNTVTGNTVQCGGNYKSADGSSGFSGSGVYTNFTIKNGIITNAS